MGHHQHWRKGFALPTVLIASVVMLTVLAVSVSSVATIRVALKEQYYEQLAKAAGEAGVAYAKACLAKNGNVPQWTDDKPLTPATDCAGNLLLDPEVEVLIVAGGGGGGNNHAGGGGGGGVIQQNSVEVSVATYPVVVGAGGAGGNTTTRVGGTGSNSSSFGLTAIGGGGGGGRINTNQVATATTGGSGGGGAGTLISSGGIPGQGAAGTVGQGNAGGNGTSDATAGNGGGGGGAGAAGGHASGTGSGAGTSGAGGDGVLSLITGSSVYYGAGGSGGRWGSGLVGLPGKSGAGIGGNADSVVGAAGIANTGGGGGGGGGASSNGGAGGSGVVVIRYGNTGAITATGGSIFYSGPYKIHRFTTGGNFTVTAASDSLCPTDPRCSVMVDDGIRSSFRVTRPLVDTTGKAVSIPNSGYVELLRTSNGAVWRTYTQPSTQAAVVPDLCSGAATTALGWKNAVKTTVQDSLPNTPSAESISDGAGAINPGYVYLQKDFVISSAGTYSVSALTPTTSDGFEVYVDGTLRLSGGGSHGVSSGFSLSTGCHVMTVKLTNASTVSRESRFTGALKQSDQSTPIIATDTSWLVSTGGVRHFAEAGYYANQFIWPQVQSFITWTAQAYNASWQNTSGDPHASFISPTGSGCPATCPQSSSTYLRDDQPIYVSTDTEVRVSTMCDDSCQVYIDGEFVLNGSGGILASQKLTLTPGFHHVGAKLINGGASANASGIAISVVATSNGAVLTRTDLRWQAVGSWTSGTSVADIYSFDADFTPNPWHAQPAVFESLVVAGGGGGGGSCSSCGGAGGGGGGGVIYTQNIGASTGARAVVVGAGGAGGAGAGGANRTNGTNGGNSTFNGVTATGGGGGGAQLSIPGNSGGSGGGGAGGSDPAPGAGGAGVSGQGWAGGAGITSPYGGGGGGGAAGRGIGANGTISGNGGSGFTSYMTGSLLVVGSGGGGGTYNGNFAGAGIVGSSGNGVTYLQNGGTGYPGTVNRGGGGGGAAGSTTGGSGGAGSSGIVIIRYKENTMTATGGNSITTWNGYRIHVFTSSGTFNITSIAS